MILMSPTKTKTRPKTKLKSHTWVDYVDEDWAVILYDIPGFDTFENAGDCSFDTKAATRALEFFPIFLSHVKGPKGRKKEPFELELWQQAIIANIFGWKRPDKTRRFREAFIYVPKKNGKTPMTAGIVLFGLLCDNEPGAEIYSAAGDREQAKLIYHWVKGMIRANKELRKRCRIYINSVVEIDPEHKVETGSFYKPISAEAKTKEGYNSHIVVVDELHVQPNRLLVDNLETSTAARDQPLIVYITTADFAGPSICNEKYDVACKVRDNIIPDSELLPVIYEADKKDDWKKESTWKKANPNYGVSVRKEYIKAKCKKAINNPPFENTFKRLHLNIQTETAVRWMPMEQWDECSDKMTFAQAAKYECFGAMDLSAVEDFTCYARLFRVPDGRFAIFPKFYIPKETIRMRENRRDKVPISLWVRDGFITVCPGRVVQYDFIKKDFEDDYEKLKFKELAFDRWNFEALRQQIVNEGVPEDKTAPFGQGFASMSAPTKELLKLVLEGRIIHNGNPVLRWMISNVTVDQDPAGNIKPNKEKSGERIDGAVASIMALGRAITVPPKKKSVYETRGIITA
jgi:phage terminase large subunit-like protein